MKTGNVTKKKPVTLNDGRDAILYHVETVIYESEDNRIRDVVFLFAEPSRMEPTVGDDVSWEDFGKISFGDGEVTMIGKAGNPFGAPIIDPD